MRVSEFYAMLQEEDMPGVQKQMMFYSHLTFTQKIVEARKEYRKKQRTLKKEDSKNA